jgi:hypothetical protein
MPVRGSLRLATQEPVELGDFSFRFEVAADTGFARKLIMEIANVPREHWPTTTYVEPDPHATIPRWPFEVNPDAWPAPGSEDTELGVLMGPEVDHGEAEVHARVQA